MKQISFSILLVFLLFACKEERGEYVCTPCDLPCDTLTFKSAGTCPHCKMDLVKKSELIDESKLALNEVDLQEGSGVFLVDGGENRVEKSIKVYYHKPQNFTSNSKILMIVPGAGRNGDSYRDAWIEESQKHNVLVLSPMFEEEDYSFEDYHLCGLISASNLLKSVTFSDNSNIANLNEETLSFELNQSVDDWIFSDFDRIFDMVVQATGSSQTQYDLFGHSAGGQILHRMAIFSQGTKTNKIIAANSGFFTLPDDSTEMPFGIMGTTVDEENLKFSFNKELIVLVGELDNENEQGGTLLRSETVDKQGLHRYARAQYFYNFSKQKADEIGAEFNWEIEVVPDVGHNHEGMGAYAGMLLYE